MSDVDLDIIVDDHFEWKNDLNIILKTSKLFPILDTPEIYTTNESLLKSEIQEKYSKEYRAFLFLEKIRKIPSERNKLINANSRYQVYKSRRSIDRALKYLGATYSLGDNALSLSIPDFITERELETKGVHFQSHHLNCSYPADNRFMTLIIPFSIQKKFLSIIPEKNITSDQKNNSYRINTILNFLLALNSYRIKKDKNYLSYLMDTFEIIKKFSDELNLEYLDNCLTLWTKQLNLNQKSDASIDS